MTFFPALERSSRRPLDAIAFLKVRDNRDFPVRGTLRSRRPWTVINPPPSAPGKWLPPSRPESGVDFVFPLVALLHSFAFTFRRRLVPTSSAAKCSLPSFFLVEKKMKRLCFWKIAIVSQLGHSRISNLPRCYCRSCDHVRRNSPLHREPSRGPLCHCNRWPRSARCNPVLELFIHSNARVFGAVNIAGG